jgi:hypothetical protein
MESSPIREIDLSTEYVLEFRPKAGEREERDGALPLDEEVDVALRGRFSTSN